MKTKILNLYKDHLYRNASYIIANIIATSATGFIFWMACAIFYSANDVGLASAMISAMNLLAVLSILGFGVALIRFLPEMKRNNETSICMINSCFTISGIASVILSAIFLIGLCVWSSRLIFVSENLPYVFLFILIIFLWTITTLLNGVFIAYRSAKYMFIKNSIFGILRIPVLLFTISFGVMGIFSSWGIGVLIATVAGFVWFVPKVLPEYKIRATIKKDIINKMLHFSFGNYIAGIFVQSPGLILPLIILDLLSPEMTAYFYISWMIATLLFACGGAVAQSLLAEGSHDEKELIVNIKKSIKYALLLLIPGIICLLIFGEIILLFFGEGYAENGTNLLYLLVISSVLFAFNQIYLTIKNVRKKVGTLVVLNGVRAFVTLGMSWFLIDEMGLVGVGVGWIIGNIIVTVIAVYDMGKELLRSYFS